ncbi:alpha-mannosidase [Xenococcus sp. PCC 7305]|uniref:alpha-mannosidase n=1 Tax=Xenococcus sp. PCC 7305 TaxID=102125 RepID=UPI0002ABB264|nr:alpha-mannosidase [Xenococcus sp. PCC 7305]ELS01809.1 alpha-mannosidase [Xenococcus sp. PCC 7305]
MTNSDLNIIENAIAKLRAQTQLDIQDNWHYDPEFNPQQDLKAIKLENKQKAKLNENKYIVFPKGRQIRWLVQKIKVPQCLKDYPLPGLILRLVLTWWAEDTRIFVNGKLLQEGDLFDSSARVLITNNAIAGEEFLVAIRLVSPNHDIGALMRSHLVYEKDNSQLELQLDPGLVANELSVLAKYITKFEPEKVPDFLVEIKQIDWNIFHNMAEADRHLDSIRQNLLPLAKNIKQREFNLLGHAHLDMAWLWTTAEAYEVAQRTFKSVLNLQQDYPTLTFCHTSPALYQWIEENCPDIFTAIQDSIRQNKWEAVGGMWIEPEVNIISGESIIRQLLYGQKYHLEKFGSRTKIAWLPDSFGFPWQFPQLLQQCGIDYFVTSKLHWNDTTKFPHGCFWWESPDGTKLLTLMAPPNVAGVMDTNPITMTNHAVEWESQTGLQDILWLPGVGDHGGGPTRDMLDVAALWQKSPFFPDIKFTTATEYLDKVSKKSPNNKIPDESTESTIDSIQHPVFPIHNSELYLELHRGCYTTHAEQKRFNRYCENLLYQAELFATLGSLTNRSEQHEAKFLSWQDEIEKAWKKVLFNQFHDILPGTSIPEVFTEANQEWDEAVNIGERVLRQSLEAIASFIKLPDPPTPDAKAIVIFNALNWMRSQIVSIPMQQEYYQVYDLERNPIPCQITDNNQLLFTAKDIPSVGYSVYWLSPILEAEYITFQQKKELKLTHKKYSLENKYLSVEINPETGDLNSIYDKINRQEILSGQGNQLQSFTDKGQYWDAWNIDPEYEQKALPEASLKSIQWLDQGIIQQSIRVVRIIGQSEFIQDYILEANSPALKISTTVDWQETHVLVKAAFPLTIESDYATYEIACGAIERPTKPQTVAEKAKWETSALKWVDLTDQTQKYGVSLLNDCKYGYDIKPSQIRITLLRSPLWPDPNSDRGKHQFTYAIYPHRDSWQQARTVHKAYELNIHLQIVAASQENQENSYLDSGLSFLNLSADNLILMAFKGAENTEKQAGSDVILRYYECHGEVANLALKSNLGLAISSEVNCLEEKNNQTVNLSIDPWKVKSFKLN